VVTGVTSGIGEALTDRLLTHGMTVIGVGRDKRPAAMFARTLLHLGVEAGKLLEVCARLAIWVGPIQAAEAAGHLQKAIRDYQEDGLGSLERWLPGIADRTTGTRHGRPA